MGAVTSRYQGGLPGVTAGVDDLPALDGLAVGEAREDHLGPYGPFAGRGLPPGERQAHGDHVPFHHDGLDVDPHVGELLLQAREGALHPLGTATDAGRLRVKLVVVGVQLVGQIQPLPIDHLFEDAAHDGLVLLGAH
jgi:hypothetical protein